MANTTKPKPAVTSVQRHADDVRAAARQSPLAEAPAGSRIKVRATSTGYYEHARRRIGDVFMIDGAAFSDSWMELVDADTPERTTTAGEHLRQEHDRILGGTVQEPSDSPPTGDDNPLGA